jgi:hypothetical protein
VTIKGQAHGDISLMEKGILSTVVDMSTLNHQAVARMRMLQFYVASVA